MGKDNCKAGRKGAGEDRRKKNDKRGRTEFRGKDKHSGKRGRIKEVKNRRARKQNKAKQNYDPIYFFSIPTAFRIKSPHKRLLNAFGLNCFILLPRS